MNCKYCGKTLANNDDATSHISYCKVYNKEPEDICLTQHKKCKIEWEVFDQENIGDKIFCEKCNEEFVIEKITLFSQA